MIKRNLPLMITLGVFCFRLSLVPDAVSWFCFYAGYLQYPD